MTTTKQKSSISSLTPLGLSFRDRNLEQTYLQDIQARLRRQGQTAMLIGIFVYLLCGILDIWFVPHGLDETVWRIRLTALCMPSFVLLVSLTPLFDRQAQLLLAAVCLAAGTGLIGIQMQLPVMSAPFYYPALVLLTFYTYNFIGVRFIYALAIDLSLLTAYNLVFGTVVDYPPHILLGHDIFIISANLIGGSAGYLAERQKRLIYLRERELDHERQFHLDRSMHDSLTGLPNREMLYERIRRATSHNPRSGASHYGFFIDLDGFKTVNDHLGHVMGDNVLRLIAQRLSRTIRESDMVARIGGDEFFVLAHEFHGQHDAQKLADKLADQVARPLPNLADNMRLTASIGICCFPYPGVEPSDLIRRADIAMYAAKSSAKGGIAFAALPSHADENGTPTRNASSTAKI